MKVEFTGCGRRFLVQNNRHWSEEDRAFLVDAPEPQGGMADGAIYEEAVAKIQPFISDWMDTA